MRVNTLHALVLGACLAPVAPAGAAALSYIDVDPAGFLDLAAGAGFTVVPAPAAGWLLAPAIGLLGPWVRRRRRTLA